MKLMLLAMIVLLSGCKSGKVEYNFREVDFCQSRTLLRDVSNPDVCWVAYGHGLSMVSCEIYRMCETRMKKGLGR
jgi:hypothetical protein